MLGWIILALLATFAGSAAYFRLVPSDPAEWHVDPLIEAGTDNPNQFRLLPAGMGTEVADAEAPVYPVSAERLAWAFDAYALARPRTARLAGSPEDLWVTYIQQSRVFAFPDYVSVRFFDLGGEGSTLAVFSRSRFGKSDLGVNFQRVETWVNALGFLARGNGGD